MSIRTTPWWLAFAASVAAACAAEPQDPSIPEQLDSPPPAKAVNAKTVLSGADPIGGGGLALTVTPTITSLVPQASSMRLSFTTGASLTSLRLNRMDRTEGYYVRYASLTPNTTGSYVYDDANVISGHEYCYVVVATETGQTSSMSSAAMCGVFGPPPPAAPTNFVLDRASERSLELTFTDASSDETSFAVERASVSGAWLPLYTLAASTGTGAVRSFTAYDLDSELSYCFRVRAVGANGSSLGPVACGKTAAAMSWPPVPSTYRPDIITILHPAPGQLTVQWMDGSSYSTWVVETYDGLFGSLLTSTNVQDNRVPRPQTEAATIFGLTPGRLYCFQVNRLGSRSLKVCEVPRAARTADDQREPSAAATPELMTVSPISNTSLRLSIVNPQPGQMIERVQVWSGVRQTLMQDGTARGSIDDAGLISGQAYCYRLWAFNQYGSRYSDLQCGTTTALPPDAPRNLRVINKVGRDVSIAWDSGRNAADYSVTWTGTRSGYTDHDGSRTTSSLSTTVTGYDQFTYCFRVRSRNSYGTSAPAELCGVLVDNGGVVSYGSSLRQVAAGQTTFSHRVDAGVGPTARLTSVSVAGNGFTPYVVQFIAPGQFCENNPSGGVIVEPGQTLMGSGLMTLFGASEPVLPLTLFACKRPRSGDGNNLDPMPIQVTYRR